MRHTNLPRKVTLTLGEVAAGTSTADGLAFGPRDRLWKQVREGSFEIHLRLRSYLNYNRTATPVIGYEILASNSGCEDLGVDAGSASP